VAVWIVGMLGAPGMVATVILVLAAIGILLVLLGLLPVRALGRSIGFAYLVFLQIWRASRARR